MSFQQDYVLRMIQDVAAVLTRVAVMRREKKNSEALLTLADETTKLTGIPPSLVYALSDDDLIETLQARGALEPERCRSLAELFREEGSVFEEQGDHGEAVLRFTKAARLYGEALARAEGGDSTAAIGGIRSTLGSLHATELPVVTVDLLVNELLDAGRFDLVDNLLFEMLDSIPDDDVIGGAIASYRQMLAADDQAWAEAGVTRDEITATLHDLERTPTVAIASEEPAQA